MLERIVESIPQRIVAHIPEIWLEKAPGYSYVNTLYHKIPSKYRAYHEKRTKEFKDIHKGQRCFVVGTGPSLNVTNLSLIKDEVIWGVNTLYRGLSKFGITCDYWAVSDMAIWQNYFRNVLELDAILFLSGSVGRSYLSNIDHLRDFQKREPIIIRQLGFMWSSKRFSRDLSEGIWNGNTVIIDICLQAAYYMGFKEVYLLGCDCDYSGPHRFDGLVTERKSTSAVKGDFSKVFKSYEICRRAYEEDGRRIINATVGGKLEVFERRKLEEVV